MCPCFQRAGLFIMHKLQSHIIYLIPSFVSPHTGCPHPTRLQAPRRPPCRIGWRPASAALWRPTPGESETPLLRLSTASPQKNLRHFTRMWKFYCVTFMGFIKGNSPPGTSYSKLAFIARHPDAAIQRQSRKPVFYTLFGIHKTPH